VITTKGKGTNRPKKTKVKYHVPESLMPNQGKLPKIRRKPSSKISGCFWLHFDLARKNEKKS
jgi:hypothetical protein